MHIRQILHQLCEFRGARLEAMIQIEVAHVESRLMHAEDWKEKSFHII